MDKDPVVVFGSVDDLFSSQEPEIELNPGNYGICFGVFGQEEEKLLPTASMISRACNPFTKNVKPDRDVNIDEVWTVFSTPTVCSAERYLWYTQIQTKKIKYVLKRRRIQRVRNHIID